MKLDTLLANQEQIKIDCENAVVGGFVYMLQQYFRQQEKDFLEYFQFKFINVINHKWTIKDFHDGFDFGLATSELIDIMNRKRKLCFEYGIENAKLGINQVIKFQEDVAKQIKDMNAEVVVGYVNSSDYARDAMIFINQQNDIFDGNMLHQLGKNIDKVTSMQVYDQLQLGFANMEGMNQLGERVQGVFDGCSQTRALMIARTETMRAFNSSTIDSYSVSGIDLVQWLISNDERTCEICLARDGGIYKIENPPINNPLLDSQFKPLGNPSSNLNYNYFFNNPSRSSQMTQMLGDTGFANSNVEILNSFEMKYKYGNQLAYFDNKVNKLFLNGKYYSGDFKTLEKYIQQNIANGMYKQGINGEWFLQREVARNKWELNNLGFFQDDYVEQTMRIYTTYTSDIVEELGKHIYAMPENTNYLHEMLLDMFANNKLNINMTGRMAEVLDKLGETLITSPMSDLSNIPLNLAKRGHLSIDEVTSGNRVQQLVDDAKSIGIDLDFEEAKRITEAVRGFSSSSTMIRAATQGLDYFKPQGYATNYYQRYLTMAEDVEKYIKLTPQIDVNIIFRGLGDVLDSFQYLPIGAEIELGGPASFSTVERIATGFMEKGINNNKSVMLILKGESKYSASIRHIAAFEAEQEVLVSGIPKYRILNMVEKTNEFFLQGAKKYLEVTIELIE